MVLNRVGRKKINCSSGDVKVDRRERNRMVVKDVGWNKSGWGGKGCKVRKV